MFGNRNIFTFRTITTLIIFILRNITTNNVILIIKLIIILLIFTLRKIFSFITYSIESKNQRKRSHWNCYLEKRLLVILLLHNICHLLIR